MSVSCAEKSKNRSVEQECLNSANFLITKCKASVPHIHSISEINSSLIVSLFEKITNVHIPDLLSCTHKIDEAHNVQAVIDTLSLDLLGMSLSHITGESVVAGDVVAILNLLEVLLGVLSCGTSSSDQKNKKSNLKRKFSQKRKSQSQLSSEKQKSSSSVHRVRSTRVLGKIDRASSNHPHPLDDLLEQLQKKKPKRISSRIKQKHLDNNGKKSITSENLDDSSIKSPPSKLRKHSDRKVTAKETEQPVDELDHDKAVPGKTQKHSQSHQKHKSKSIQNEAKPVDIKKKLAVKGKRSTTPKNVKRKTSKPIGMGNTVESIDNKQEVEKLYEKNLKRKIRVIVENNSYLTSRASRLKKWHLQTVRKPVHKKPISVCRKSFLLPHSLRQRSVPRTALKRIAAYNIQPHQNLQKQNDNNRPGTSKSGFIQELLTDFPCLELPPMVVNHITKKYHRHLTKMHTKARNCLLKIPKTQTQADEAAKKQLALSNLIKKDVKQQQFMKGLKENKENENKMKYYLRDVRMQSAKMKQYSNEFQVEMHKKMQKRNFAEELIFEKVFEDALQMQKEQVDHLCKEVKETGENDARKHLIYLDALENLYQTQFTLMSETLALEKQDTQERVKAEKQAMDAMQREFQEELKQEIRFMQQAIIDCTEDTHFRELDANQYTEKLRKKLA